MAAHSDWPFMVTAALLVLWGTGRNDSNVTFFGVVFVCAYLLVEGLSMAAQGHDVIFPNDVVPHTDMFSTTFAGNDKALSYFLMMAFCFTFGVVGTTVFAFSPFVGELLYATIVAALFRDVSVVGDARVIVWASVLISGALSEHIFRLNLAVLALACLCWEKKLEFSQRGAFETTLFLNGVLILTVHDIVVRFLLEPIKALVEAGFLGMTAFVMVDSAIELGALPSSTTVHSGVNITGSRNLMNIKWTDCLESDVSLFGAQFPRRVALASPVLSCFFCAAYFNRTIRAHHSDLNWVKMQQVIGVGIGTLVGLHLWTRYGGVDSFQLTSPIAVCWVSTALLFYTSTLLNASSGASNKREVWHQTYWRGASFLLGKGLKPAGIKAKKSTPYPTLLLGSSCATYPEIYDLITKLEDAHYAFEANFNKLHTMSEKDKKVEYAKQAFACTQCVSTLVKYCEDLASKVEARIDIVQKESQVLSLAESSVASKSKQKLHLLQQDLVAINSYAEQIRRELAKRDDEALRVLESALEIYALNRPIPSPGNERQVKTETDELDQMCEAVRKRIKHRKKKEDANVSSATDLSAIAHAFAPTPPSVVERNINDAGNTPPLPVIPQNQAMFSSDRGLDSKSPSPAKKRGLFDRLLSRKKGSNEPSLNVSIISDDHQSASSGKSGSAKKWGSFMRRKVPASPSTPPVAST